MKSTEYLFASKGCIEQQSEKFITFEEFFWINIIKKLFFLFKNIFQYFIMRNPELSKIIRENLTVEGTFTSRSNKTLPMHNSLGTTLPDRTGAYNSTTLQLSRDTALRYYNSTRLQLYQNTTLRWYKCSRGKTWRLVCRYGALCRCGTQARDRARCKR